MPVSGRSNGPGQDAGRTASEYRLEGGVFRKEHDPVTGRYRFFQDGRPISLREWNRAVNLHQPMENKLRHPFFLVRLQEKKRRRTLLRLVEAAGSPLGADVGCESGKIAASLAANGARIMAVDLDRQTVLQAAKSHASAPRLRFLCADVCALPLPTDTLDFCLCSETLEHVEDPAAALEELCRVTRPGGKLILSIPNEGVILFLKGVIRRLGLGSLLGKLSLGQAMGHLQGFGRREFLGYMPKGCTVLKVFYDKPFFMNLYVIAEVRPR